MSQGADGVQANSKSQIAALTPRPRRLVLIGTVKPGIERAVREVQAGFPDRAAAEAGIASVEAFIGSGFYVVMLEIDGDDVQEVLAAFFNHPLIREFHAALRPLVDGLPGADDRYGSADAFHDVADRGIQGGLGHSSAELPLAASMYRWRDGAMPDCGAEPQGHLHTKQVGLGSGH